VERILSPAEEAGLTKRFVAYQGRLPRVGDRAYGTREWWVYLLDRGELGRWRPGVPPGIIRVS